MSGTLFGLALSQQHNSDGKPLASGKLYIFAAGTQTPVQTYKNFALSAGQEHPHPIVLDSRGRVPAFWLADGSARARLTDAAGVVHFDEEFLVLGPSSGGGGGGADTTNPNAIFTVGDFLWRPTSGVRTGWVRGNGRTIGSAGSGAAERAAADCENLFLHLWNNYLDAICPVSGGRGASAAADWSANKQIGAPSMRGKGPFGLDGMGSTRANVIADSRVDGGLTGDTAAAGGGDDDNTLTIAQLPSHPHDDGSLAATSSGLGAFALTVGGSINYQPGGSSTPAVSGSVAEPTVTGSTGSVGSGQAHNNMPPFMLGTWYIFLG